MSALEDKLRQARALIDEVLAAIPKEAAPPAQPVSMIGLQNPAAFYDHIRGEAGELFPMLTEPQLDGIEAVLKAGAGAMPLCWQAYVLATDYHETGKKMQPVREGFDLSDAWRKSHLRYYPYYGRGLVQLTWEDNYRKVGELLSLDLVDQPDLALQMKWAVPIMLQGMLKGWFSGKALRDFIPQIATREHYKNARRIVNGTDKADLIAGYAIEFEKGLRLGDWR